MTETATPYTPQPDDDDLLTVDETKAVILALLAGRRRTGQGATKPEIEAVIEWARQTRTDAACLALVLDGQLLLDVAADNQIIFAVAEGKETTR